MTIRYIADMHFDHADIIPYDNRPFDSIEEMNDALVQNWNRVVRDPEDLTWILGDFCMGNAERWRELLGKLNGRKSLILGNHDNRDTVNAVRNLLEDVSEYREILDGEQHVVLCHYPVMCYNGQYRVNAEGAPKTYMLYGHVHNTYDEELIQRFVRETRESTRIVRGEEAPTHIPCQMINCFCMRSDYRPLTLDEWIALDRAK